MRNESPTFRCTSVRSGMACREATGVSPVPAVRLGTPVACGPGLYPVLHHATEQVDRLVLLAMILHRKRVSRLDVQDLSDVTVGPGPDRFVAPRLRDSRDFNASAH